MKKRKRNLYFGFGPASKKERAQASTWTFQKKRARGARGASGAGLSGARAEVASALLNQGYKEPQARKMAAAAKGSDFGSLFRDAIKRNPRVFPGSLTESEIQALRKLARATMAQKKKRRTRKKKNSRKGTMPAGLRKYWAKKRAKKNSRRRKAKRNTRPRARRRKTQRVKNFRRTVRRPKARRRRRVRTNPRRRITRITAPSGLGPKGLRQFRSLVARITGKRTRIVSK
jgi:hypothetical protein